MRSTAMAVDGVSAARRRRERRMRSFWPHEQMAIQMSTTRTLRWTPNAAPRGQKLGTSTRGVGFELVLDPVVPQLGHELMEVPTAVSQPEFQQQSVEQNVDISVCGGVGHRADQPAGVLSDLEQVRRRTDMEVMRWFVDPARCFTLTSEEPFSMVRLMPDYRRRATGSPGRYVNTGRRAGAGARAADPGGDRGGGGRAVHRDSSG